MRVIKLLCMTSLTAIAAGAAQPAVAADAAAATEVTTAVDATTATATAGGAPEAAQPEQLALIDPGEIVVTARHREEKAQTVPVSFSVITADALDKTGDFTIAQIQQIVPTLQLTTYNPRNTVITIRGLGANSSIAVDGLEYGVGFYLDGVYYGRPGQQVFDLIDLNQVEVLRGPQGTLFGKNTTAGAVNITSRLPSFRPEATAEVSGGNYGYHQERASISGPIIADKVAVRLSVAETHRDGFLKNLYDGRDAENYENFTARGQLLIKPTEDLSIRIIGDYAKQKQHFALNIPAGYFTHFSNGAVIGNNILDREARTGFFYPTFNAFDRVGVSNSPFRANMESYGVSGEINWNLGAATLTSITAYRWWDWYPLNDTDGTPLSINTKNHIVDHQRQFSQELRVASNGHHTIDYVAGLYYFWQIVRGYQQAAYGPDYAAWNLPSSAPAATINNYNVALTGFEANAFSNPQTRSYAAFGQVDWHIAEPLTLTTGLRYTHEDKQGIFNQYWVAGADPATLTADQIAIRNLFNPIRFFSAKNHANALSGLATLSYKPTRDILLYATYARGNKSGGLNLTSGGILQPVVKPEKINSYEVGVKSQLFNRKLTVNADLFQADVQDYQAPITTAIGGTTTYVQYIANVKRVRSRGVEADVTYAPSKWVTFTASASYTDARYVSYKNAPNAPENNPTANPVQDLSGKRLPNVPKFAYSLGVDLAQPVGGVEIYGHADYSHRSSYNSTATNSIYGVVPGYGILNGRVGVRTANGHWDLSVWARNLTNKNYYVTLSPGNFGLITALPGDPRTFGATLRASF